MRHRVRIRFDAQLECNTTVQRQAGRRARKHVGLQPCSAVNPGGLPTSTGSVNSGPSAAKATLSTSSIVPLTSVAPVLARQDIVSSARVAVVTAVSAATGVRRPAGKSHRDGRQSIGTSPRPMVPRGHRPQKGASESPARLTRKVLADTAALRAVALGAGVESL